MAYSADQKPSGLTAITTLATDDTFIVGDTSDTTEVVKTITKANLITDLSSSFQATPAEGAFVDGDKTKLDGIETGADVTDTANVTAAGALMDSEVTNLAQVKAFNSADYATAAQGATADAALPKAGGTMSGDIAMGDNNVTGVGAVGFTQELDNGSKTTDFSIDFTNDQHQKVTLTANTMTLTLDTTTVGVGVYTLKIINGGLATLTWASETGSVTWPGGTAPTLTSSGTDIISCRWDGTNWQLVGSLAFS